MIKTACDNQRFPVAHVEPLDGVAVERLLEDGKHVPLQTALSLLHRVAVEEKVVRERDQELIFGTDREREDVVTFLSVPLDHPRGEDDLLGSSECDLLPVAGHLLHHDHHHADHHDARHHDHHHNHCHDHHDHLLHHPHGVVAVAADEATAKSDQARDFSVSRLNVFVHLPDCEEYM